MTFHMLELIHWNGNIVIVMAFSSLAALEVVKVTTSSAAGDENVITMMTFLFRCTTFTENQSNLLAINFPSIYSTHHGLETPYGHTTFVPEMVLCLMTPNHYLSQYWLIIMRWCGIHRWAILEEMLKIYLININFEINDLELQPHLTRANELYLERTG